MPTLTCTPKRLPDASIGDALLKAVAVNPLNHAPVALFKRLLPTHELDRASLSILTSRKWHTNGVRLTVGFLDTAGPALRARILGHMNAWAASANVTFTETHDQAQVRIAFGGGPDGGYWSYLGTDILLIEPGKPTMNLQEFTMNTSEAEFIRVVRHETGHTLGFPHEHMRRELVAKIDREKAIAYYIATQGWTRDQVIAQVLTPIEDGSLLGTPRADSSSIMCYQIPGALTIDGQPIPGGIDIDAIDYAFAATCYPRPASPASANQRSELSARATGVQFSQAEAETCVIAAVKKIHGTEPSLTDTVSDVFGDLVGMAILLGGIQDRVANVGIGVTLSDADDATMNGLRRGDYLSLAAWVRDEVRAKGTVS